MEERDERKDVVDTDGNEVTPLDDDYYYFKTLMSDDPLDDDYCKYDHE